MAINLANHNVCEYRRNRKEQWCDTIAPFYSITYNRNRLYYICACRKRIYNKERKIQKKMELTMKKIVRNFILAVLGGAAIGIGGIVYLSLEQKIIGALLFTAGLYTICLHGLNLYTGKVGYAVNQPLSYFADLLVIWAGNLCGTACAAFAVRQTRVQDISEKAAAMCETKLRDSYLSLFLLAVFCGFLMYVAVDGYKNSKNPLILFTGVSVFILCGFEHCIADMFYFSVSKTWSVHSFCCIVVITLGNSAGAVLIPFAKKLYADL